MTSMAAAQSSLPVQGLVFFGFPLHAAGKPSAERADHLYNVKLPLLFLQGTRDRLSNLELLRPLLDGVKPRPSLYIVDDADHGFHVPKRSGRTDDEVLDELCAEFAAWAGEVVAG